ncbi:MAG: methyltransferase family protein [uncultured bacterium]|nr:MAG: methyltransferase family protein [uncultured bacterium]
MDKAWTNDSHKILVQASGLDRYNGWLVGNFSEYFGKAILEIGSGQGALSKLLPSKSIVVLSDVVPEYLSGLKKLFTDPVIKLDIEKEAPAKLIGKMDTIFSSNVFEHIKDDQKAFKNCFRLLKSGGHLLLFVPARPEIYGRLDEEMGHYRRYVKSKLAAKAKDAGFNVLDCHYANLLGYFLWWGRGMLSSAKSDSRFANFYDKFIVPLLYLEKYVHPPFGQSLVLIAQKS